MDEITEQLWVSGVDTLTHATPGQFELVVGVCHTDKRDLFDCEYAYYDMADGVHDPFGDNSNEYFFNAVNAVRNALADDSTVLVHCQAGQSRSVTVAAAALACEHGHYNVEKALTTIESARPEADPGPSMVKKANAYVNSIEQLTAYQE